MSRKAASALPAPGGDAAEADRGPARLVADIRKVRQQLSPASLNHPGVNAELQELYKQVAAGFEQSQGRHRLPAGVTAIRRPATRTGAPVADASGFNLKPDPLTARTSAELVARLRQYREWSGEPSFRVMAAQARQKVAHSTMFAALHRDELPSMKVVTAIVAGCGGSADDERAFVTAWRRIKSGCMDAVSAPSAGAGQAYASQGYASQGYASQGYASPVYGGGFGA
jgi:hypothetical protein